jgi:WD40 repeat protein
MWLLLAAVASVGCGSTKTTEPQLTPREIKTDGERLSLVRFSPDGQWLVAGTTNGELFVWRDLNLPPLKLESGHSSPILSLSWSPDGLAVATFLDRGLVGWRFDKAEPTRVEMPGLPSAAVCVAFRPQVQSREFVLGMRDGSLIFVDVQGSKQSPKPVHRGPVKQVLYSSDGKLFITAGAEGQLLWHDAASRKIVQTSKAHTTEVSRLLLSPNGQQLISGDWNGALQVWDVETRKSVREFQQPEAVSGLGWIGSELVSAGWDGSLRGWETSSGRNVRSFATAQPLHDLACDSKTSRVVTVSLDRTVRVWEWPGREAR